MTSVFHTVLSGASVGMFVLAAMAFALRFVLGQRNDRLAHNADVVVFAAAATGVVVSIFTGLSGYFLTWPQDAIRSTLLTQNKVLASVALLMCWGMLVLLRWRVGEALWTHWPLKLWAALLVAFGMVNVAMLGSMGGSAALQGSLLDPALTSLNINRFVSIAWGPALSIALIVVGLLAFAYPALQRSRQKG